MRLAVHDGRAREAVGVLKPLTHEAADHVVAPGEVALHRVEVPEPLLRAVHDRASNNVRSRGHAAARA